MPKKIVIYTPSDFVCPYCKQAKDLLKRRGIEYQEIQLSSEDDQAWDDLYVKSKMKTVPQIFAEDKLIGGYSELAELDGRDSLECLK